MTVTYPYAVWYFERRRPHTLPSANRRIGTPRRRAGESSMHDYDKSTKWLIQHDGDAILRLAGVRAIAAWTPR